MPIAMLVFATISAVLAFSAMNATMFLWAVVFLTLSLVCCIIHKLGEYEPTKEELDIALISTLR